MAAVPRRVLEEVVEARLETIPNLTVYRRQVAPQPPTIGPVDTRVRPYVVQHPSAGVTGPFDRLGAGRVGLAWITQLTCVVGDNEALGVLVDAVTARFDEWRPTLPNPYDDLVQTGRFRLLNDPGPGRRDDTEQPSRFWTPLVYSVLVNH